jgi:hypothetical protein
MEQMLEFQNTAQRLMEFSRNLEEIPPGKECL